MRLKDERFTNFVETLHETKIPWYLTKEPICKETKRHTQTITRTQTTDQSTRKKMKRETNKKASNTNRKIHSEHSIWNTTNVISVYPQLRSMHTEHQQICNERTMERERDSSNCMCVAFSSLHSFRFICFVFFVPVFHLFSFLIRFL